MEMFHATKRMNALVWWGRIKYANEVKWVFFLNDEWWLSRFNPVFNVLNNGVNIWVTAIRAAELILCACYDLSHTGYFHFLFVLAYRVHHKVFLFCSDFSNQLKQISAAEVRFLNKDYENNTNFKWKCSSLVSNTQEINLPFLFYHYAWF